MEILQRLDKPESYLLSSIILSPEFVQFTSFKGSKVDLMWINLMFSSVECLMKFSSISPRKHFHSISLPERLYRLSSILPYSGIYWSSTKDLFFTTTSPFHDWIINVSAIDFLSEESHYVGVILLPCFVI